MKGKTYQGSALAEQKPAPKLDEEGRDHSECGHTAGNDPEHCAVETATESRLKMAIRSAICRLNYLPPSQHSPAIHGTGGIVACLKAALE